VEVPLRKGNTLNKTLFVGALLMFSIVRLAAVDSASLKARFVTIEKKAHDRLMYNIGNTPVTRQDFYYAMTLDTSQGAYHVEYDLRSDDEELPAAFVEGGEVDARVRGRHLFLKSSAGNEIDTLIVKRDSSKRTR
jgi:hypothetical protein